MAPWAQNSVRVCMRACICNTVI